MFKATTPSGSTIRCNCLVEVGRKDTVREKKRPAQDGGDVCCKKLDSQVTTILDRDLYVIGRGKLDCFYNVKGRLGENAFGRKIPPSVKVDCSFCQPGDNASRGNGMYMVRICPQHSSLLNKSL